MADEMRDARQEEAARVQFERSRDHAVAVREAIRQVDDMHAASISQDVARETFESLDRDGPLIVHEALRRRIRIAALVAFTASQPDDQFSEPGLARLQVRIVGQQVQWAIENYLRGEPLPPWPAEFPMQQWAQAWTSAAGEYRIDPNDESAKTARAEFDALTDH